MKKILYIFLTLFTASSALANQPKDWQLGFQDPASDGMRDIVNFHNNLLLPIIIAISVFVLFLMLYACVRFRASANPNPSKEQPKFKTPLEKLTINGLKFRSVGPSLTAGRIADIAIDENVILNFVFNTSTN